MIRYIKNGPPMRAVMIPMGSSLCVDNTLVIVSQKTKKSPPKSAVFMILLFILDG